MSPRRLVPAGGRVGFVCALSVIVGALSDVSRADVLANFKVSGNITLPGTIGTSQTMGATYSLHAGASAGGTTDIMHNPAAGQPASANVMPTYRDFRLVQTGPDGSGQSRKEPVAVMTRLPNGNPIPYASNMGKGYNDGITKSSGVAQVEAGTVLPPGPGTLATAEAAVQFTSTPIAGTNKMSYAVVPKDGIMSIITNGAKAPPGTVSSLIVDPTNFAATPAGTVMGGGVNLASSGVSVNLTSADSAYAIVIQAGSNFAATTSGTSALGTSINGLPLIYELDVSFIGNDLLNPFIALSFNSAYTILNPDTGMAINPSNVQDFVSNRLHSALSLSGTTVTLNTSNLELFDYSATSVIEQPAGFSTDYVVGELGATGVPEPGCLVLTAVGIVVVCFAKARPRRLFRRASP